MSDIAKEFAKKYGECDIDVRASKRGEAARVNYNAPSLTMLMLFLAHLIESVADDCGANADIICKEIGNFISHNRTNTEENENE